jgi:hypothetical protein
MAFLWKDKKWRLRTLPFGLSNTPYTFAKLLKPVVAVLRKLGLPAILHLHLDDMLIMAQSIEKIEIHLASALELLIALGFAINAKRSGTEPHQALEFLGFILNAWKMTIRSYAH